MRLKSYLSDKRGVVTLEFMMLVPALFLWFAGTFVFFQGIHGWMKAKKASYAVSDMLSRQTEVDNAFIDALDGVFDSVSQSEDFAQSSIRVSSVYNDATDGLEMKWHWPPNPPAQTPHQLSDITSHIPQLTDGEYILVVETFRPFTPLFDWVGLDPMTFENTIGSVSRFSAKLSNTDFPDASTATDDGVETDDPDADPDA
ncbi:hypothetical protein GCM10007939_01980 [Amylibacter marinus]|uniref:TadE-like protein n=1 Tax=Amylibacter marinus TaxID=1475483 RepID=A0ABQ5VRE2_9RHOB|nr:hypothetical protein [Amylibacter marinus]GLQ33915.1 hypothetical protein GCM10007939_01980 [Amylibacter marinus]